MKNLFTIDWVLEKVMKAAPRVLVARLPEMLRELDRRLRLKSGEGSGLAPSRLRQPPTALANDIAPKRIPQIISPMNPTKTLDERNVMCC
ncbi:MAG: hypothetical protein NZ740_03180 [Kiritimatiellae bacterium]|nr:hypothetical protein [Kiritimatiellia bacterium]MDW8458095.1 hypothetical protein [Verrucomicrobiota bacterium]